ncbi:MAG TPA: FAD-binding oxidoreductase [Candidatus Sulfopaludibacter sp.]|nr:FAD-binding oxidoreductase [Candidatus Sulfopaludibacter sp.]
MKCLQDGLAAQEWASVVGPENVVTEKASLQAAETGTFATGYRVPAILRPGSRQEVQECLRIANRCGVPVYPISSGKNWGYGSRMPAADQCVLMDLGRMNRILDFSEELAYVTVEPGVTQAQLYAFLQERGSRLCMDATGASPACSLIGNTVERGFGHTPYGDHFAHSCGLEVVLPTGEIIETGFARFAGAQAAPAYRWGVGPTLDGLFSQSNLGIVTRMTIWLMPAPEYFQAYYFRCEKSDGLAGLIDGLRPLRLNGTIRSASHIANDYKVISALQQYPWREMNGQTPLTPDRMGDFRREMKIGHWNGSGALYGTKRQVAEGRRLLRQALKGKAQRLQFMDDRMLALAGRFAKPYQMISGWNLERTLAVLKPVYGLMKGIPTDHPLASTYWRKRTPPPAQMDPDRDGCGLLWCSPVAPNDGKHAERLTGIATDLVLKHGFEPAISLTVITERALACIISLAWDRAQEGEDQRAMACYRSLLDACANQGYHSYRLSVGSMDAMGQTGTYFNLLQKLKSTVDPGDILSPGRYIARTSDRLS